jgi:hypothetical protein
MEVRDTLLVVAEISMAFVGFSALLSVFQRDPGIPGAAAVRGTLITNIVELGFAALFFALLPSVLAPFGWTEARVWGVASGLLALFQLAWWVLLLRRRSAATSGPARTLRRDFAFVPMFAVTGAVVLALLATTLGFYVDLGPAFYLFAVVWLLATAAFFFLAMLSIFGPPRRPDSDA